MTRPPMSHWCKDCPYIGNDEVCWSACELEREIAQEFEPESDDDVEDSLTVSPLPENT